MSTAPADAYDRHVGRYGAALARSFADFADVSTADRVLDVGCGPGALASELAGRLGAASVAAVDPSPAYVEACRTRVPDAEVREGTAEDIPFAEGDFDAVLAQLVIQAMKDPRSGVAEMRRVLRPGGTMAACVWDFREGMPLLVAYWGAAAEVDPEGSAVANNDTANPWCEPQGLRLLWEEAGLKEIETAELQATASYDDVDDAWWSFAAGVSPSGAYCRSLDEDRREQLRAEFVRRLDAPEGSFELTARAWAVRGLGP